MKRFEQFIKEEIDLKGNTGIPDDLMSNADKQAQKNLGIRKDDPRQMMQLGPRIMGLVDTSQRLMKQGLNREDLEERYVKIETLAKDIILEKYSDLLVDANGNPVELDIKLIREGGSVRQEIPEMADIPAKPSQEEIKDTELRKAVDKKKILNVINQGEAKATKDIIRMSELVKPALTDIFGDRAEEILKVWLDTTDLANKIDWVFPIEAKSQMMKDVPQGMAGACQVKWEKEENEDEESKEQEEQEVTYDEDGTQLVGDQEDYSKITIKAVGIDFPMLIHEAVKGIWSLLKSGSIKDDEEMAKLIAQNTSSFEDESQDFRYGVAMQAMFRDFIDACKDSGKYSNMNLRVYGKLALDKDRDGEFTDGEFLELSKSIFGSFNLVEGATLEFVLDTEKFNASPAKRQIERLISDIVSAEEEYEKQLSEWEMDQQFGGDDSHEDVEGDNKGFNDFLSGYGIGSSDVEEEEEEDLSKLKQSQIQSMIDDALDREDYTEVARISKYLKEGKEIYLKELERVNESYSRRKNK